MTGRLPATPEVDPFDRRLRYPRLVRNFFLADAVPFAEHLGYLRVAYAVIIITITVWPAAELRSALQIIAIVVVWHVFYVLAVRSYQKSKARLQAFRTQAELAGADENRGQETDPRT